MFAPWKAEHRSHEVMTPHYDPQCFAYSEYRHASDASWQAFYGTTTLLRIPHERQSSYSALQGALTLPVERSMPLPQQPYMSKHRPRRFRPNAPLQFRMKGHGFISLHDACVGALHGLERRDEPVVMGSNCRKTLRLQWPKPAQGHGYEPYSHPIYLHDDRDTRKPITLGMLAHKIAQEVKRFIELNERIPLQDDTWKVGAGHITLRSLVLVEIRHVSEGSIQPILRVLPQRR